MKPLRVAILSLIVLLLLIVIAESIYLWRLWPTHHGKPSVMSQTGEANAASARDTSKIPRIR